MRLTDSCHVGNRTFWKGSWAGWEGGGVEAESSLKEGVVAIGWGGRDPVALSPLPAICGVFTTSSDIRADSSVKLKWWS